MRILHVTDTYLPTLGGIELHVRDLAERQAGAGHHVAVLAPAWPDEATRDDAGTRSGTVAVHRVPSPRVPLVASAEARRVVDHLGPDVIHAHLSVGSPFAWAVVRAAAGRPVLATMHSMAPPSAVAVTVGRGLMGTRHGHVTMSAVSRVAADRISQGLRDRQPVHVLPNGIDVAAWQVEPQPHATLTVTSVGRLAARKRPTALVEALADVHARAPEVPWRAVLVGDGPQRQDLHRRIERHGLVERVILTGGLDRQQIREVLAHSDVFVAPARLESFGIAALEARCAGLPVVAMAGSGVEDFVRHGTDGLLVADDRTLAEELLRLVTDPAEAEALASASRQRVPRLDWTDVLRRHDLLYARARTAVPRHAASAGGLRWVGAA